MDRQWPMRQVTAQCMRVCERSATELGSTYPHWDRRAEPCCSLGQATDYILCSRFVLGPRKHWLFTASPTSVRGRRARAAHTRLWNNSCPPQALMDGIVRWLVLQLTVVARPRSERAAGFLLSCCRTAGAASGIAPSRAGCTAAMPTSAADEGFAHIGRDGSDFVQDDPQSRAQCP